MANIRIYLLSFLCLSVGWALLGSSAQTKVHPRVCVQESCVDVEIVSKPEDMTRGLQGRTGLGSGRGMLFAFSADARYKFWMKDMKFALDIIWIDRTGRVVSVGPNLPACTADPCLVYTPSAQARYVLEIPASSAARYGFVEGAACAFKDLPKKFIVF